MKFLCIEFINSSWYITHHLFADPLRKPEWLSKLLGSCNMVDLPQPTEAEVEALIVLRSSLTEMLKRLIDEKALSDSDIKLLNSYMQDQSFCRQLLFEKDKFCVIDIPQHRNWAWFMSEVAASFASLYSSGAVLNLKACQNPQCGWLFIDASKSGNRKWCDDSCATLMKVRRFREKQREKK